MSELDGEIIERLLFDEGFEFERSVDDDFIHSLKIYGSGAEITLSEIWEEGGNWFIDPTSMSVIGKLGGRFVDLDEMNEAPVYDEQSLVRKIVDCISVEIETGREAGIRSFPY